MNSNDWQDIENVRNQAIAQLAEICAAMGLSWTAGEKEFVIALPHVVTMKAASSVIVELMPTKRKTFDISTWGDNSGVYEGSIYKSDDPMPDDFQMPDYGEILDEGKPPKGYNEDEELNK